MLGNYKYKLVLPFWSRDINYDLLIVYCDKCKKWEEYCFIANLSYHHKAIRETKHTATSHSDEHIRFPNDFFQKHITYAYASVSLHRWQKVAWWVSPFIYYHLKKGELLHMSSVVGKSELYFRLLFILFARISALFNSFFFLPMVFWITCHYSTILGLLLAYEGCTTIIIDHLMAMWCARKQTPHKLLYSSTAKCAKWMLFLK